jgi:molecular chaperone HscA
MLLQIHEPGNASNPVQDAPAYAVGIDFGTTHSVIAVQQQDEAVRVLEAEPGRERLQANLLPSIAAYREDGRLVAVGQAALFHLNQPGYTVIRSVKRLLGRGLQDIEAVAGQFAWPLVWPDTAPENLDSAPQLLRLQVSAEHQITAVEVASDILRALKTVAEDALGQLVTKAVITVPAYFDDAARMATRDAARLAGLEVLRLLNEPTAAALAYGLDEGREGVFLVYDLGGGTFDVSLLKLDQGVFRVLATAGDIQYGGDDLDQKIVMHWLAEKLVPAPTDSEQLNQLLLAARQAKEGVTRHPQAEVTVADRVVVLDRATLDQIAEAWLQPSLALVERVLQDAAFADDQLDGIVLVGGSTRLGAVKKLLGERFSCALLDHVNPDEVVAVGAARQAHALTQGASHLLLDVTPLSLGLETMGGVVEKLIHRNSPIPCQASVDYTTYQDGQTAMWIHVVQGEWETVERCRSLARFTLNGIPPMAAGLAKVRVTFALDADGLLTVTAKELTTGVAQEVAVKPSYGLSAEEMVVMLTNSLTDAADDLKTRLWRDALLDARRLLSLLQLAIARDGDLLDADETALIAQQQQTIEQLLQETADQRDSLTAAIRDLERLIEPFAERRVNRSLNQAIGGKTVAAAKEILD